MYPQQQWQVSDYVPPQINEKNLWLLGVVNSVGGLGGYIAVSIANHTAWAPPVMFVGL